MAKNSIKLSIITVAYNNSQNISSFAQSLVNNLPDNSEILVVDNASHDDTVKILSRFKRIEVLESKTNVGFSKGCNMAASKASGEFLFFLNPDVEVANGITEMISYLEDHTDVGLVVPKLLDGSGKDQTSVTRLPTLLGVFKEYVLGFKNAYSEYSPNSSEPVEIEAAYGAAFLIKRAIFQDLKGFDERYFLYYEDIDLCKRIREKGYQIVYYPKVHFTHHKGLSVKTISTNEMNKFERVISWFYPLKSSGSRYYNVKSSNLYHGAFIALLIHLVIFLSIKIRGYKNGN